MRLTEFLKEQAEFVDLLRITGTSMSEFHQFEKELHKLIND